VASLDPDGTLNWREEYLGSHTEATSSIGTAPGGVVVGGTSSSRGQDDWPVPWLARLDANASQTPDGFDPRVHGFGFANWAGVEGIRKNGEPFTLPYSETSKEDARDWILGLDDPKHRSKELWDGGVNLAQGLYRRQLSTDGHCLGMVLSANHYFKSPEDFPPGVQFAQSVPHPTDRYESVGERIRSEQDNFSHGRTATQLVLALNAPAYDPQPNLTKIRRALSRTGTAPIALEMQTGDGDSQDKTTQTIFHSGLVYHQERTDDALELYYYDPDDPAENYKAPDEVYGVELDEEDSHLDRAFEKPRYSLRVDPTTGELLDNTHPAEWTVTVYAYFPVGGGAAVEDTFETDSDRANQRLDTLDTLSDSSSTSVTTDEESSDIELTTLDGSEASESTSSIESRARPDIALPSLLKSAIIATLESEGTLRITTPDGRVVTSDGSEYIYKDATEYTEMVWAVGIDPGETRLDVVPETDDHYMLRVRGKTPSGGEISETIERPVGDAAVQHIDISLPEEGSGSLTVSSSDTLTDESSLSEGSRTAEPESSGPFTSANGTEFDTEVLAALGIMALIASGYLVLRNRK